KVRMNEQGAAKDDCKTVRIAHQSAGRDRRHHGSLWVEMVQRSDRVAVFGDHVRIMMDETDLGVVEACEAGRELVRPPPIVLIAEGNEIGLAKSGSAHEVRTIAETSVVAVQPDRERRGPRELGY